MMEFDVGDVIVQIGNFNLRVVIDKMNDGYCLGDVGAAEGYWYLPGWVEQNFVKVD